jgi:BirA family transcriptional regulator, biotin operon repressor / biotin---[acetyl-CoA-carboxylase] ligase
VRRPDLDFSLHWRDVVPSTMDVAGTLAADPALRLPIVVADAQTAGRGRRGHTWESPPGAGLYLSLVWREAAMGTLPLLTLAAGIGVREGIAAATGLAPEVKWPNDLIVGRRKLAGLLAEGVALGSLGQSVIVGVGVNLMPAAYPPDVAARATSLEGELGRDVDRGAVMCEVISAVIDRLSGLSRDPGGILQAWRAASPSATGTRVEWEDKRGVTAGVDDSGALLVKTNDGIERIIAGELHWHL